MCTQSEFQTTRTTDEQQPEQPPATGQRQLIQTLARRGVRLNQRLGSGAFGAVHAGELNDKNVAIKVIEFEKNKAGNVRSSERLDFESEVLAMERAKDSQHVIHFEQAFQVTKGQKGIIVMELGQGRDLEKYLNEETKNRSLPKLKALDIGLSLARGMAHLHALNLVHRDIKPANIMVDDDVSHAEQQELQVKLVDFGMAAKTDELTYMGGTLSYMSNDCVTAYHSEESSQTLANPAEDVFAFGCVLLELFGGAKTFQQWNARRDTFLRSGKGKIPKNNTLCFPPDVRRKYSRTLISILNRCFLDDTAKRPKADELILWLETTIENSRMQEQQREERKLTLLSKRKVFTDVFSFPIALRVKRRCKNVAKLKRLLA